MHIFSHSSMTKNLVSYPYLNVFLLQIQQHSIFLQRERCCPLRLKVLVRWDRCLNSQDRAPLIQPNLGVRLHDEPYGVVRYFHPLCRPEQAVNIIICNIIKWFWFRFRFGFFNNRFWFQFIFDDVLCFFDGLRILISVFIIDCVVGI